MPPEDSQPALPPGIVAFVKRDCPTCELVEPVLADLAARDQGRPFRLDRDASREFPEPAAADDHGERSAGTLVRRNEPDEQIVGFGENGRLSHLSTVQAASGGELSRCQALANSRLIEQSFLAWSHCSSQEAHGSAWHLYAYQ